MFFQTRNASVSQFHSQLEKSEGIIPRCSFLSESEGSWHWQNKEQISGKHIYIYICIYSSISGIQVQVSILLGWLSLKDLSFLILLRCVVDIYIYVYVLSTMTVTSRGTCTTSTDSVGLYNISSLILDFFHSDVVVGV